MRRISLVAPPKRVYKYENGILVKVYDKASLVADELNQPKSQICRYLNGKFKKIPKWLPPSVTYSYKKQV